MCQWSTSIFENSCRCTAFDVLQWKKLTEQIDWLAEQPSQMHCVFEDMKCWGAWDSAFRHKAKEITTSTAWRRGTERGSARRSSLKGRERTIVNKTNIGTVSKATFGKRLRDGVERIWVFERIDAILDWTELKYALYVNELQWDEAWLGEKHMYCTLYEHEEPT